MSVLQIPLETGLSAYTVRVPLDETMFRLTFRWNERALCWFMDVHADSGEAVVTGLRVVVGLTLLRQHRYRQNAPKGNLVAFDTTNRAIDPGLNDFGTRVVLLYIDAEELEALSA